MRYLIILLFITSFFACNINKKSVATSPKIDVELERLVGYMIGSFNSGEQASKDSTYYNISLKMYPIWPQHEGKWLYVEQALYSDQMKPYRQRIYKVENAGNGVFKSHVYLIPNDEDYIGAWATPTKFDAITPKDIDLKNGCEVVLKHDVAKEMYVGKTGHQTCESSLRGARYATSEVAIYPDKVISWDQGFNERNEQVWGATEGGYIFNKVIIK